MRMTERVARAIHSESFALGIGGTPIVWEDLTDDEREAYAEAARKVIGAMRTPTDAMLAEGNRRAMPHDAGNVWERMVYQALYEDDGTA